MELGQALNTEYQDQKESFELSVQVGASVRRYPARVCLSVAGCPLKVIEETYRIHGLDNFDMSRSVFIGLMEICGFIVIGGSLSGYMRVMKVISGRDGRYVVDVKGLPAPIERHGNERTYRQFLTHIGATGMDNGDTATARRECARLMVRENTNDNNNGSRQDIVPGCFVWATLLGKTPVDGVGNGKRRRTQACLQSTIQVLCFVIDIKQIRQNGNCALLFRLDKREIVHDAPINKLIFHVGACDDLKPDTTRLTMSSNSRPVLMASQASPQQASSVPSLLQNMQNMQNMQNDSQIISQNVGAFMASDAAATSAFVQQIVPEIITGQMTLNIVIEIGRRMTNVITAHLKLTVAPVPCPKVISERYVLDVFPIHPTSGQRKIPELTRSNLIGLMGVTGYVLPGANFMDYCRIMRINGNAPILANRRKHKMYKDMLSDLGVVAPSACDTMKHLKDTAPGNFVKTTTQILVGIAASGESFENSNESLHHVTPGCFAWVQGILEAPRQVMCYVVSLVEPVMHGPTAMVLRLDVREPLMEVATSCMVVIQQPISDLMPCKKDLEKKDSNLRRRRMFIGVF